MLFSKKTKILATLGPETNNEAILLQLAKAGMNGARFNFSHGEHEDHKTRLAMLRRVESQIKRPLSAVVDLQGRKIRLGKLLADRNLQEGEEVILFFGLEQTGNEIPIQIDIFMHIKRGDIILINDGTVKMRVTEVQGKKVTAVIQTGGVISSNKGINLPDTKLKGSVLTEKDKNDLAFILPLGIEYVALSFVQDATDIQEGKEFIAQFDRGVKIIAKIECSEAIRNLESIIKVSDMVMIARGDMAVEIGQEEVPIVQQEVIQLCRKYGVPVIVATQMLESMIYVKEPTRAEVNDVASAVFDQVDSVMLSAETAAGKYPVLAVSMMERIIQRVGKFYESSELIPQFISQNKSKDQITAIANAATVLAKQLEARCIVTLTESGHTAKEVATCRPQLPIIAMTDDMKTYKQLVLLWGTIPYFSEKIINTEETSQEIAEQLKNEKFLQTGDRIVVITGTVLGLSGNTNTITVATV